MFLGWDSVPKGAHWDRRVGSNSSCTLSGIQGHSLVSDPVAVLIRRICAVEEDILMSRAVTAPLGSGCWGTRRGEEPYIFARVNLCLQEHVL